jgi:hypothetical protein
MAKPKTKTDASTDSTPTPEERLHTLRSLLAFKIESSKTIVGALAQELSDPNRDPIEVLAWSTRAFEAAAVLQVATDICKRLDAGEALPDLHASLQREALRGARSGSSSTSPVNNFSMACRIAAVAEFEELMRYDAKKIAAEVAS